MQSHDSHKTAAINDERFWLEMIKRQLNEPKKGKKEFWMESFVVVNAKWINGIYDVLLEQFRFTFVRTVNGRSAGDRG